MNRFLLCFFYFIVFSVICKGQLSEGGIPASFSISELKRTSSIPSVHLKKINTDSLNNTVNKNSIPYIYGIITDTILDIKKTGKKNLVAGKGNIWRLRISSENVKSIKLIFKIFIIPEGASLFVYNDNFSEIYGAFTNKNIHADSSFAIADFRGDHIVIEYFEPQSPEFEGKVILSQVSQAFRDVLKSFSSEEYININCAIGKDAQLAKHSVCKMSFTSEGSSYTCSGALINNAKSDGTPYFLTAHHCISKSTEASSLITYFNYENVGCNGGTVVPKTLSGAQLLSTLKASDYTLLLLDETPTAEYQPFYAGWNAKDSVFHNVTGIHHPQGTSKKISIDYDTIINYPYELEWDDNSFSPVESHWEIIFDDGATSNGSSGSPLFNLQNQIIGQLHGGLDEYDYYGRFHYSYSHKPANFHSIRHFLDPDSTGINFLAGYSPVSNHPDAFFTTAYETVCNDFPLQLTDYSVFGPYERQWIITPGSYSFYEGNPGSANPVIKFQGNSVYTVTLNLFTGGIKRSTESMSIYAGDTLDVNIKAFDESICDCDFDKIELNSTGASDYAWSVLNGSLSMVTLNQTTGNKVMVQKIPEFLSDSSYTIGLKVIGTQSTCTDSSKIFIDVIKQPNDNVADAINLNYGLSKVYSNVCATIEDGEPIPPHNSCTSQYSWCDEYGTGENIVENSVWFKFNAGSTGKVSISSNGFDNEIALYEADSYTDILAGNYLLIAANDDRSVFDPRPTIISQNLTPGKTYWLQVDGSGWGEEDDFTINILDLQTNILSEPERGSLYLYPQPVKDFVYINTGDFFSEAEVTVYNITGATVLRMNLQITGNDIPVDMSNIEPGIYILSLKANNLNFISKIIKQ